MTDKKKVYGPDESARVMMSKMSPKRGDIIAIKTPADLDYRQMALLAEQFRSVCEETGCAIMFTTDDIEVGLINEQDLNAAGYYKLHDGRPMKGTH